MDWSTFLTPVFWTQLLASAVSLATPLILAALGEVFAERSGIINLGIEGMMLFSGFMAFTVAFQSGNIWTGVLLAVLTGALMSLLFAFMTITLRSNQTVTGLSLNFLGQGLAMYQIGRAHV